LGRFRVTRSEEGEGAVRRRVEMGARWGGREVRSFVADMLMLLCGFVSGLGGYARELDFLTSSTRGARHLQREALDIFNARRSTSEPWGLGAD